MGELTHIQWTQKTWNPWQGCTKVSPGCAHCYMYRDKTRYGQDPTTVVRSKDPTFYAPLKWTDPALIFTCSWSDWFHEAADAWRAEAWRIVRDSPHTFQILTKRIERVAACLPDDWGAGYPNVWLGVSIENNRFIHRYDQLRRIPAAVRFVSAEPLLGWVDAPWLVQGPFNAPQGTAPDWVIVGGESGPGARRMDPDWARELVETCQAAGIAVFVKQLGERLAREWGCRDRVGGDLTEWPADLQVREFPQAVAA